MTKKEKQTFRVDISDKNNRKNEKKRTERIDETIHLGNFQLYE
jgi:hypothetical protein